jgi:predicted O-linked N-acetylglucosamine transferase (SPINDLY family)
MNALQIDIAIDLKRHTQDARSGILAYRPAPIQVNYLGYPGTIGTQFIDYVVGDESVRPFKRQPYYTERSSICLIAIKSTTRKENELAKKKYGLPSDAPSSGASRERLRVLLL